MSTYHFLSFCYLIRAFIVKQLRCFLRTIFRCGITRGCLCPGIDHLYLAFTFYWRSRSISESSKIGSIKIKRQTYTTCFILYACTAFTAWGLKLSAGTIGIFLFYLGFVSIARVIYFIFAGSSFLGVSLTGLEKNFSSSHSSRLSSLGSESEPNPS